MSLICECDVGRVGIFYVLRRLWRDHAALSHATLASHSPSLGRSSPDPALPDLELNVLSSHAGVYYMISLDINRANSRYTDHNKRPSGWNVTNFVSEYTSTVQRVLANSPATSAAPAKFMGPSTCCEVPGFLLSDVVNAGFLDQNMAQLGSISVQQYPTNNCGLSGTIDPQSIFSDFLNHTSAEYWTAGYGNISATAVANGKDMVMMEMNSASCGGFPGLSDSFGAAMW